MNCCDCYGQCRQGRDCPIRYACAVEVQRLSLLARLMRWMRRVR